MNIDIKAEKRATGKKSDVNTTRNEGFIPGIIYSAGKESIPIKLEKSSFIKIYRKTIGELVLFNVHVDGKEHHTVIKEKQIHPVTREVLHIDFLEFAKDTKLTVNLPLRYVGTPIGVKNGGDIDYILREIQVTSLAENLVEDIEVDVSNLDIGQSLHLGDLALDAFDVHLADDVTVAVVHPPKSLLEEEAAESAEEPAESESGDE